MGARNDRSPFPGRRLFLLTAEALSQKCILHRHILSIQKAILTRNNLSYLSANHTYREKKILRGRRSRAVSHHSLSSRGLKGSLSFKLILLIHTQTIPRFWYHAPSEFRSSSSTSSWAAWWPSASCWTRTDRCRGRPAGPRIGPCSDRWTCPCGRRQHWRAHSPVHSLIGWHIWPVAWSSFSV